MIAVVLGTRPEIVKMSPVVRECQRREQEFFVLHTGQHYSHRMDGIFFQELGLPPADHHLEVGSGSHGQQTARILQGTEAVLAERRPDLVLVQGDTNTVLGGALAAAKLGIRVGHVEAGLRSYDRRMPEEVNRILADHMSQLLFPPTATAKANLRREGIAQGVHVTGNTVVDAVRQNLARAEGRSNVLHRLGLEPGGYILATAHRQENVDQPERLEGIVRGLHLASERLNMTLVLPAHPRTQKNLVAMGVDTGGLLLMDPVGYLDFLVLEANARLVMTDSGGVQEEACVLRVPCVTMRDSTERPETLEVGANILAGADPNGILAGCRRMMGARRSWRNPFGDGRAAQRIVSWSARGRAGRGPSGHGKG